MEGIKAQNECKFEFLYLDEDGKQQISLWFEHSVSSGMSEVDLVGRVYESDGLTQKIFRAHINGGFVYIIVGHKKKHLLCSDWTVCGC